MARHEEGGTLGTPPDQIPPPPGPTFVSKVSDSPGAARSGEMTARMTARMERFRTAQRRFEVRMESGTQDILEQFRASQRQLFEENMRIFLDEVQE